MIVQLITVVILSVALLLMAWALFRTLKRPMPRTLIPLIIGSTAIGYGIYSEYTWEERTLDKMPESIVLADSYVGTSVFSPWSYLFPRNDRLMLVDTATIRRNPDHANYAMVDLLLMQRFSPVAKVRQLVDCRNARRADLTAEPEFDAQGLPVNLDWKTLDASNRLLETSCQ
ncbi:hypothetical protein ACUNV4_09235 [Granulosicoccus sp. 3-233]|uniref:hypothetical protein n=1 Tax=Granulosicoccus sp. 3-233 TaxID=3417969 RepID=UPI003D326CC1